MFEQLGFNGMQSNTSNDWNWSFEDYPSKNGIKVFSCFSCGGGSTMGYKLAGCDVLGNVEIDPKMNDVYIKNHHPKYNFCMDIREFNKIPNDEIPRELIGIDILDGSPPCTTFSMAGDREESWGKKKKFREGQKEQTLDDLSFVFIDTVKKLSPKCVIMENVEGLLLGNAFEYVQNIYNKFKSIGYDVNHYLLKAENMGIPQKRHRVFFIAVKKEFHFDFFDLDMSFDYEPVLYKQIKNGVLEYKNKSTKEYQALLKSQKGDTCIRDVYKRLGEKERAFTDKIVWEDEVLPTLTAKGNLIDGNDRAKVSGESVISMQTFPQDFNFGERNVNTIKYICGMSVPPVMMKRIAERIIKSKIFNQ